MAKKQAALVIGACSHGLSVIRALNDKGVTVFVIEKNASIPGTKSNAIEKLFLVKDFSVDYLMAALNQIREELAVWDDIVLFATNDNHVKFICDYYAELATLYKISWGAEKDAIRLLLDKRNLEHFSLNAGLNYPKSAILDNAENLETVLEHFKFPIIIKPAKPLSSFKTQIANQFREVQALVMEFECDLPFVAQEYIAGDDTSLFFCALTLREGDTVQSLVGQKIASYPPARGQTTIAQTVTNQDIERMTARFFAQFRLSGPVSLEMKKAPDNTYWVIEPTVGRTDFWSELCIKAGFNQPYQEFLIALGNTPVNEGITSQVVWFDGERDPVNYVNVCWKQKTLFPFGKKAIFTYFSISDLGPFIKACSNLLKRVIFKS